MHTPRTVYILVDEHAFKYSWRSRKSRKCGCSILIWGKKEMPADGWDRIATIWRNVIFTTDKITEIMSMPMNFTFQNLINPKILKRQLAVSPWVWNLL
jgi:hypothetical protein